MEKRNGTLTFLAALVPGVGYISLGLVKKGIQMLILFLIIGPLFSLIGLGFIGDLIRIPLWLYTFFDTFNVASKIDRGETVNDSEFIFKKYQEPGSYSNFVSSTSRSTWLLIAWVLIGAGILAIINQVFHTNELYGLIKSYISSYFFPVLLVAVGLYMLLKHKF